MDAKRPFKHRLDSVAKLRGLERDALQVAATVALRDAETRSREWQAAARSVEQAEAALRSARASGRSLSPEQELRMLDFLAGERQRRETAAARREKAAQAAAGTLSELQGKQRDLKAIERYRGRARERADADGERAALKAADEAWLVRQARRRR